MASQNFTPIQKEIYNAIKQMSEKASFTEYNLAKKVRENTKLQGKKKGGIGLADLLTVVNALSLEGIFYSIHINQVNECLLRKETEACELALESKQRRQKSEKSMEIITSGDISGDKSKSTKSKKSFEKRSDRKKMSIYGNYDDE